MKSRTWRPAPLPAAPAALPLHLYEVRLLASPDGDKRVQTLAVGPRDAERHAEAENPGWLAQGAAYLG